MLSGPLCRCQPGSHDEFVFENYVAFNSHGRRPKSFRVSHARWEQCRAEPLILDDSLLRAHFPWFSRARIAGASYSPGVTDVLMESPREICPKPIVIDSLEQLCLVSRTWRWHG
jgi:hypothetical protein